MKIDVAAEKLRVRNQAMDFDYVEAEFVEADFEAEFAAESAGSCSPLHVCSPSKHSKWDCNEKNNCQDQNNEKKISTDIKMSSTCCVMNCKVQFFWEGHKNWQNLHRQFDSMYEVNFVFFEKATKLDEISISLLTNKFVFPATT